MEVEVPVVLAATVLVHQHHPPVLVGQEVVAADSVQVVEAAVVAVAVTA